LELRKMLRPSADPHLVADFTNCRVHQVNVDIGDFERLSRSKDRTDLQAAADLYRGELLADFYVASEPFQEWLAAERDRTLRMVCDVLHRLTVLQDAAGEYDAAIRSGRRPVTLDPLSEFGQRALMRAYARAGRRGEALRQYKNCAEALRRELAVTPDAETEALAAEIARPSGVTRTAVTASIPADQSPAAFHEMPDRPPGGGVLRPAAPTSDTAPPQWPCLLPNSAVAVAPVRNLTADLLRHGRGVSLKPLAGKRPPDPESALGYDYIVTRSAQRSDPGTLRINMRIVNASTCEYLWAGRHEFQPEDLAPIQTRITRRISRELRVLLLQSASRRAFADCAAEHAVTECLERAASTPLMGCPMLGSPGNAPLFGPQTL
jgi:hypothetical protein